VFYHFPVSALAGVAPKYQGSHKNTGLTKSLQQRKSSLTSPTETQVRTAADPAADATSETMMQLEDLGPPRTTSSQARRFMRFHAVHRWLSQRINPICLNCGSLLLQATFHECNDSVSLPPFVLGRPSIGIPRNGPIGVRLQE
jgi:hypothetical protein